ncbi:acyl-CoA N-acyltransferase [Coniophora puteana RWD-64-598 SS2]|uniref:Acyl-CoA N-acyltransferase n=1 Tax=Coniophora puteana (strain RWD-64-598) TaxID=741705 RepID=A0A5M3MS58_CONPW|nr:acyl-CoA N-acyltransferase [Coniophora puteana RWD-64-598 SS2]EIW81381.1 acyl-CoA N-acyltransferase [Coniophora puteana RWD-64-598 SS2]
MPFQTERLTLRAYNGDADLDNLLRLYDDALVQPSILLAPLKPLSPAYKEKLQKDMDNITFGAVIALTSTGEFIGQSVLNIPEPKNRDASVGICLLPEFWSRGYGTEAMLFTVDHAFRWYGLHRVSLTVWAVNERAVGVYKRLGFVIEGRKREAIWMDTKWVDILSMGVLRSEWAALHWGEQAQSLRPIEHV